MHISKSKMDLGLMLWSASEGKISGYEDVELQVHYVAPGRPIEVFDRLLDRDLEHHHFVMAEYAGEDPMLVGDGRRYIKRFRQLTRYPDLVVTFASSFYQLQPVSAILQSRRDADQEGNPALSFKLYVCDSDTRIGICAFLAEDLKTLTEGNENEIPIFLSERVAAIRAES